MKANRSLEISTLIKEQLARDLSMAFYDYFPFDVSEKYSDGKRRDRIFTQENTLLTMLTTMTCEDKSLQQSVNIYKRIHEKNREIIEKESARIIEESLKEDRKGKRGRKRTTAGRIAKSKLQEVSSNTSAYTQARQRISADFVNEVFKDSRNISDREDRYSWKGYQVYLSDGTYLQMQDTEAIRQEFTQSIKGSYPRGLLEVIIEQGSGVIHDYELSDDKKSELELLERMIENMPDGSLLLGDDLYNCYALLYQLKSGGIEFIVPGKRKRRYEVYKKLGDGDELVYIYKTINSKWVKSAKKIGSKLLLRRIEYEEPNDNSIKRVLYTSLLDNRISKLDIILKYNTRWDIEVGIKEIKAILDMNIVRSKTPEMARKEVSAGLIAYNYLRRIILGAAEESGFSPQRDIIQKFYEIDKPVFIDKLGRKYSQWSPGRYGYAKGANHNLPGTKASK